MRRREFMALLGAATIPWPDFALAELERRSYRIGYLALAPAEDAQYMRTFVQRLRELGLVEGQNLTILYRSAEDRSERLPQLASELVGEKPDVLVAGFGTLAAKAAKMATATVPIVFTSVGDPIGAGLVESLGRPTGNITASARRLPILAANSCRWFRNWFPPPNALRCWVTRRRHSPDWHCRTFCPHPEPQGSHLRSWRQREPRICQAVLRRLRASERQGS